MNEREHLKLLGNAIKLKRQQLKISQEKLAELAGCHRNYVGLVETGKRNPSYIRLIQIAKALNTPLSSLIKVTGS